MKAPPDFSNAVVERAKVVDYLLGASTPASFAKSRFFGSLGSAAAAGHRLSVKGMNMITECDYVVLVRDPPHQDLYPAMWASSSMSTKARPPTRWNSSVWTEARFQSRH